MEVLTKILNSNIYIVNFIKHPEYNQRLIKNNMNIISDTGSKWKAGCISLTATLHEKLSGQRWYSPLHPTRHHYFSNLNYHFQSRNCLL